jgi:hypothetical protein
MKANIGSFAMLGAAFSDLRGPRKYHAHGSIYSKWFPIGSRSYRKTARRRVADSRRHDRWESVTARASSLRTRPGKRSPIFILRKNSVATWAAADHFASRYRDESLCVLNVGERDEMLTH